MASENLPSSRDFLTQLLNSLRTLPRATSSNAAATLAPNFLATASEPVKKLLLALHVLFPNELLPALDLLDRRLVTRFRIHRPRKPATDDEAPPPITTAPAPTSALRSEGDVAHAESERRSDEHAARADHTSASHPPPPSVGQIHSPDTPAREADISAHTLSDATILHPPKPDAPKPDADTVYYVRSAQQRSSRFSTSYDTTTCYEVRLTAWNCSCPAFAFSAFPPAHPDHSTPPFTPTEAHAASAAVANNSTASSSDSDGEWSFGGMALGAATPPVCKHLLACVLAARCDALFAHFVDIRQVSVDEAAGWAAGWGD